MSSDLPNSRLPAQSPQGARSYLRSAVKCILLLMGALIALCAIGGNRQGNCTTKVSKDSASAARNRSLIEGEDAFFHHQALLI